MSDDRSPLPHDQAEQSLRRVLDLLPQILWTARRDGTVDFANTSYSRYVGDPSLDLRAHQWLESVHPDDVPTCGAAWELACRQGTPYAVEVRLRRADGAYRWHFVSAVAARDGDGQVVTWYGSAIDVHDRHEAEQQAQAISERLQTTLQHIGDAFYVLDRNWRFTFLNPQAERLMHRPPGDLVGEVVWVEFPEATHTPVYEAFHRAMRDGENVTLEMYYTPLRTWFDITAYPTPDGLAVHFRDVTARHLAEERLRENEARFRAVARATADVVWDWDLRTDAVWWNDGMTEVFGYPADEVEPSAASWARHIHPDDHDRVLRGIHEAITRRDEFWEDEYRFLHRDGTPIDVEDRGFLIVDATGTPVRFVGGMRDIRARKAAQARLAELAALLDEARDAIYVHDVDGRITYWNGGAVRTFGYTEQEAIGRRVLDLLHLDETAYREAHAHVTAHGEWRGRTSKRHRTGKSLVMDAHWSLLREDGDQPHKVLVIGTDITRQVETEEMLRQSQRLDAVGQLTGGVAHDFNNLLTVILGTSEALVEGLGDDHKLRVLADMSRAAAQRGAELTHRLLAFSRRQPLEPRLVRVNQLVAGMEALLRRTLPESIELEMVQSGGLWHALIDPSQLEVAILNLAINARDAMPGGGTLTIETANARLDDEYAVHHAEVTPGQYVMVAVTDTGSGMTPDVLEKAFDPFFTTKAPDHGTGLGLSMVYGFVKQSFGHVKIYSEPGQGTTIKLYLPRSFKPDERPNELPVTQEDGGSEAVLLVEDDPLVRRLAASHLAALGYRVLEAANGAEALAVLDRGDRVDVLFTDVVMPGGMNGRQLADLAAARRPALRVLFTSGYTENAIVHQGRLDPGVRLLSKPYRRADLARALRQVLNEGTDR
jgi:PAS domain S-box-containing protein